MKKILLGLILVLFGSIMTGCNGEDSKKDVSTIEIIGETAMFDEAFQLSDLSLKVTDEDGAISFIPLSETMISVDDIAKLNTEGTHTINVTYLNTSTTFTITITGEKGADGTNGIDGTDGTDGVDGTNGTDGREVKLQVANGFIQWQYDGETSWSKLIAVADLIGETPQVSFQVADGFIQFKSMESGIWNDLIAISSLKGVDGTNGTDGLDGITPTITINSEGYWVINGVVSAYKATGNEVSKPLYTLTFDLMGGTMPEGHGTVITNIEEGSLINLQVPVKEGFIFRGWFTGESVNDGQFTSLTPVMRDVTLYARWEMDYTLISDFFELLNSDNITIHDSYNSTYQLGDYTYSEISQSERKLFMFEGVLHSYNNRCIRDIENGVEQSAWWKNTYIAYYPSVSSVLVHDYNSDESDWRFFFDEDEYVAINLDFLDIKRFTKDPNQNSYTYLVDQTFIDQIDYSSNGITTYEVTLNLDLNELSISISSVYDDHTSSLDATLRLSDIGSTSSDFNYLEKTKEVMNAEIDRIVATIEGIHYATDASYSTFMNMVDNLKLEIEYQVNVENMESLVYQVRDLNHFDFEIDELKSIKFDSQQMINETIENKLEIATDESMVELLEIRDNYLILIYDSATIDEVFNHMNNFNDAVMDAFIIDVDKQALFNSKVIVLNSLVRMTNDALYDLVNYDDRIILKDIYVYYAPLIETATTIDELETLYTTFYNELLALSVQFSQDLIENQKESLNDNLNSILRDFRYNYDGLSLTLYEEYVYYTDAIEQATNYFEIQHLYLEGLKSIEVLSLQLVKEQALDDLEKYYLNTKFAIDEMSYESLLTDYTMHVNIINNETNMYMVREFLNSSNQNCFPNYDCDPVKLNMLLHISYFENHLQYLTLTATDASIVDMNLAFEAFKHLVIFSTDDNEVKEAYHTALKNLMTLYTVNLEKEAVMRAKDELLENMIFGKEVLNFGILDNEYIFNLDLFKAKLEVLTTTEAIDSLRSEWHNTFDAMVLSEQDYLLPQLENVKYNLNHYLTYRYNGLSSDTADLIAFDELMAELALTTDYSELYRLSAEISYLIANTSKLEDKISTLDDLSAAYTYYQPLITASRQVEFDTTYQYYVYYVNLFYLDFNLNLLIDEFEMACNDLTELVVTL